LHDLWSASQGVWAASHKRGRSRAGQASLSSDGWIEQPQSWVRMRVRVFAMSPLDQSNVRPPCIQTHIGYVLDLYLEIGRPQPRAAVMRLLRKRKDRASFGLFALRVIIPGRWLQTGNFCRGGRGLRVEQEGTTPHAEMISIPLTAPCDLKQIQGRG
jgi:hypothetical protein